MIVFPNSKINLGLHVINKRPDGFHSLNTIFYPVNWCDALEVLEHSDEQRLFMYSQSGIPIAGDLKNNLIYKAWQLLINDHTLPPLKVHLHKNIPMGAGLGGGSSDAAFFISLIDSLFSLKLSEKKKIRLANELGSDCAFFIKNNPVYAEGRGNEFSKINLDLSSYYILIIYPEIHSTTAEAFSNIRPNTPALELKKIVTKHPLKEWKNILHNDFEETLFDLHPTIRNLKNDLYAAGALYASMSGSGSAVYGIFEQEPTYQPAVTHSFYVQKPHNPLTT